MHEDPEEGRRYAGEETLRSSEVRDNLDALLGELLLLDQVAEEHAGEVLLLDNTEVLFSLALKQDPLRLLQGIARDRTVVAAWAGECEGESLTYADPTHTEYRRYQEPDAVIVPTLDVQGVAAHEEKKST